jgi:DNA polymerase-3 subunit alpha
VEALLKAGAFDSTGYTRRQMMRFLEVDQLMAVAAKRHRDKADGQVSLFDLFDGEEAAAAAGFEDDIPEADGVEWDRRTKLNFEKDILKMYVSDHPLSPYSQALAEVAEFSLGAFMETEDEENGDFEADGAALGDTKRRPPQDRPIQLAGMITGLTPMVSKKNERMAKFTLEDMEGSIGAIIFPSYFAKCEHAITEDAIVKVRCRYERNDRGSQILVTEVAALKLKEEPEQAAVAKVATITFAADALNQQVSDSLMRLLKRHPGKSPVVLRITRSGASTDYRTELPLTINATAQDLQTGIHNLSGKIALS